MASLASLPIELIGLILLDLSQSDKHSLCIVCRSLNMAVAPALYEDIDLVWTSQNSHIRSHWQSRAPRIESLLRTLLQQPKLAALVKSLDFHADLVAAGQLYYEETSLCGNMNHIALSQEDQSLFQMAIGNLRLPEADKWSTALMEKANLGVVLALVMGTCIRLESLMISREFLVGNDWFSRLIRHSFQATTHGIGLFSHLSQVHITSSENLHPWDGQLPHLQTTLCLCFYLPLVEILGLSAMSDFRRRNVYDDSWDTIKTLTWPLEQPPNGNNITILRLLQFSIHPETLSYFLRQTPNVHTFELSVLEPVEMETNDITAFREALHPIRNTLRDLTIRYTVAEEEECPPPQDSVDVIDGSLGPLHDFPILTSLTVSLAVLFGRHGVHTGRYPQLVDFLAPRLQKLTITDDLWMYSDFQGCFEDMDAMQIFRRFLTGEMVEGGWTGGTQYEKAVWVPSGDVPGWKVATPDLKEFVYDIREHIQESHGYWSKRKYRNELRRATRGQGLECTVLHR